MPTETLFSLAGMLAMTGWLALLVSPLQHKWLMRFAGYAVPLALSTGYAGLVLAFWSRAEGGYGSLAEVASLFETPEILLAGWVHYLAFDLFIGAWIVRDARANGLSFIWALPCLPLTFLFGPAGLLGWFGLRAMHAPRPSPQTAP